MSALDDLIMEFGDSNEQTWQDREVKINPSRFKERLYAYDPFDENLGTGFGNFDEFITTIWKTTANPVFDISLQPTKKGNFEILAYDNGSEELRDMDNTDASTWFYEKELKKFIVIGDEQDFDQANQIKFWTVNTTIDTDLDEFGRFQGDVYVKHRFKKTKKEGVFSYGIIYLKKIIPFTSANEEGDYIRFNWYGSNQQPINASYVEITIEGEYGLNRFQILDGDNQPLYLREERKSISNQQLHFTLFWPTVQSNSSARINLPFLSELEYINEVFNETTSVSAIASNGITSSENGVFEFIGVGGERTDQGRGAFRGYDYRRLEYIAGPADGLVENDVKTKSIETLEYLLPKTVSLFGSGVGETITTDGELPRAYTQENPFWTANSSALYVLDAWWRHWNIAVKYYIWFLSKPQKNNETFFLNHQVGSTSKKQGYYVGSEEEKQDITRLLFGTNSYLGQVWGEFPATLESTDLPSDYIPNTVDTEKARDFGVLINDLIVNKKSKANQITPWVQTTRIYDARFPYAKGEYLQTNETGGRGYGIDDSEYRKIGNTKTYLFKLQTQVPEAGIIVVPKINQFTLKIWGGYLITMRWLKEDGITPVDTIDEQGATVELAPSVYLAPNRTSNPLSTTISRIFGSSTLRVSKKIVAKYENDKKK